MGGYLLSYSSITVTDTETTLVESAINSDGEVNVTLDLAALISGDTFEVRIYVKVDGTNYRLADAIQFSGAQTYPAKRIAAEWANADMDLKVAAIRLAGANRAFGVRTRTRF